MKSILMTTSAVLLVTGFAAGQAQAACPEDIDSFNREYEETLQNAAAGEALSTSEQAQLFGLRTAAENLYRAGNAEMCAEVIERAQLILNTAIAPQIIKPSELVGREVVNAQDENLGEIEDVMIDPISGRIAYVVVEHGGFLGIGQDRFAVPWAAMQFVPGNEETVLLDIPEEKLENAPRFSSDDETPLERREWVTAVHSYYGVEPYWQDSVGSMAMQHGGAGLAMPAAVDASQPQAEPSGQPAAGTGTPPAGTSTEQETETQTEAQPAGETAAAATAETETEDQPATEDQPQPEGQSGSEPATDDQSAAEPQTGTAALVATQPQAESEAASSDQISTLISRIGQLEKQVQELTQRDFGADVEESIASLEQQVQTLSQQAPGEEVTQSISRLEEQIAQLSEQGMGEEIRQQIARLEEQVAALAADGGTGGQTGQPAAIVVVPDQETQSTEQQQKTDQQQSDQQQSGQQQPSQQRQEAGAAQQGADVQGRTVLATPPVTGSAAPADPPCEEMLAQLEDDLKRAEELGVAINDAVSEFEEAQAMLNNNSEALCRAAIRRAHEELVAVGFEPTQTN